MEWRGHLKAAVIITSTAAVIYSDINNLNIVDTIIVTGAATASSLTTALISDLDSKNSKISQKLPIVSWLRAFLLLSIFYTGYLIYLDTSFNNVINKICIISFLYLLYISLAHRKLFHSLLFFIPLSLLIVKYIGFSYIFTKGITLGLISGMASHLIGDMFTERGCLLLYPLKIVFRFARFKSGKDDNKILFIIILLCILILFGYFFH